MAEDQIIVIGNKQMKYEALIPQIKAITMYETNIVANMANVTAALFAQFNWLWVGFYLVDTITNELVLAPFQGPIACTRIAFGKGVCGTAWEQKKVQIVADVHQFPGHIACSSASNSEIVLPIFDKHQNVIGVLDVDSEAFNTFDSMDEQYLNAIIKMVFE